MGTTALAVGQISQSPAVALLWQMESLIRKFALSIDTCGDQVLLGERQSLQKSAVVREGLAQAGNIIVFTDQVRAADFQHRVAAINDPTMNGAFRCTWRGELARGSVPWRRNRRQPLAATSISLGPRAIFDGPERGRHSR